MTRLPFGVGALGDPPGARVCSVAAPGEDTHGCRPNDSTALLALPLGGRPSALGKRTLPLVNGPRYSGYITAGTVD